MRFFRPLRLISAFLHRRAPSLAARSAPRGSGVAWQKRRDLVTEAIPWNGFVTVRAER